VTAPDARTERDVVVIEGVTEPGVELFVAGDRVPVRPDGSFAATTALRPGVNLLVVEAVDTVGNAAYRSIEIRRMPAGGGR
jgi:hypothetical protein